MEDRFKEKKEEMRDLEKELDVKKVHGIFVTVG